MVVCVEIVVDQYSIEKPKAHITACKSAVDKFCEDVKLSICKDKDFMSSPLFFVIHDMRLLNLFLSGNLIIVPSTRSEFCYEKLSKISLNLSK